MAVTNSKQAPSTLQVLAWLQQAAPPELAESWDNVGLLVDAGSPMGGILVTLDITPEVVAEAVGLGCGLIVSHHPVIFSPLKVLGPQDVPALLMKNGISAICMHTNLDAAQGGVNDTLAELLKMQNTIPFADGCGRLGELAEPVTVPELARFCADALGAHCKWVDNGKPVHRLAEVSGSGGSFWEQALELGADCLLTGEANHHAACDAKRTGLGLVVAGHWNTERPIVPVLAQRLAKAFPGVPVQASTADADPYAYL